MEEDLAPDVKRALWKIQDMGSLARRLVKRGHDAYRQDGLLWLAAEAIMRRLADAVAELDEAFLADHPEVDWAAMRSAEVLGDRPEPGLTILWSYLSTQLPADLRAITVIQDAWSWRPLPGPADGEPEPVHDRVGGPIEDDDFRRAVQRLHEWTAGATAPGDDGPIDVTCPDGRKVRIHMSARDLADMHVVRGTLGGCLLSIAYAVRELLEDVPYLVYGPTYTLVPSATPTLPPFDPETGRHRP